jgi:hypothetical protein
MWAVFLGPAKALGRVVGRLVGLVIAAERQESVEQAGGSTPRGEVSTRRATGWADRAQAVAKVASRTRRARVVKVVQVSAR